MWTKISNDPKLGFGGAIFAISHTTFRTDFQRTLLTTWDSRLNELEWVIHTIVKE